MKKGVKTGGKKDEKKVDKKGAKTANIDKRTVVDLYLAKNLDELHKLCTNRSKQLGFEVSCKAADTLWKQLCVDSFDEEKAYILNMRYVRLLRDITAATDGSFVYARFGDHLETATTRISVLRLILINRYKERMLNADRNEAPSMLMELDEVPFEIPTTSKNALKQKYMINGEYTDPKHLFQLLEDKVFILIIDIRDSVNYADNHILTEAHMINICGELIVRGLSVSTLAGKLSGDTKTMFQERKKYDFVVVVDDCSFPIDYVDNADNKLLIFFEILMEWDINSEPYKNVPPVLLAGGFCGWRDHYPALCHNPTAAFAQGGTASTVSMLADTFTHIDYPVSFDYNAEQKALLFVDRSLKPTFRPRRVLFPPADEEAALAEDMQDPRPLQADGGDVGGEIEVLGEGLAEDDVASSAIVNIGTSVAMDLDSVVSDFTASKHPNMPEEVRLDARTLEEYLQQDVGPIIPPEVDTSDADSLCKHLACFAVMLWKLAERRYNALTELIEYREVYKKMNQVQRELTGNPQLIAFVSSIDELTAKHNSLSNDRVAFTNKHPIAKTISAPHGTIRKHVDQLQRTAKLQFDALRDKEETKKFLMRVRVMMHKEVKRTRLLDEDGAVTPPQRALAPQVPDRTKQPASAWVPVFPLQETITGLTNYHNNCYLNATIQALRFVPTVYDYILRKRYIGELVAIKSMSQSNSVMLAVAHLVQALWNSPRAALTADALYRKFLGMSPFEDYRHEDGYEAFTLLFTRLSDETERPMNANAAQRAHTASRKIVHWKNMHNHRISYLSRRFFFEMKRTRICNACKRQMVTFDISNTAMLPMQLPPQAADDMDNNSNIPDDDLQGSLNLQQAIIAYMELPDRYKILCTICKSYAVEYKELKYYPECLVINLKRHKAENGGQFRHNGAVSFPETGLKVGAYMYRLNSFMCHSGTIQHGHYTTVALNPIDKIWYWYDDERVTIVENIHADKFRRQCYVLFYSLETEFQRLNTDFARL